LKNLLTRRGIRALVVLALSAAAGVPQQPAAITVDYPANGSVFPPDFTPPTFLWRDSQQGVTEWSIEVTFAAGPSSIRLTSRGEPMSVGEIDPRAVGPTNQLPQLSPEQAAAHTWMPGSEVWEIIKKNSVAGAATIRFTGHRPDGQVVSRGQVVLRTSQDPVGAPIFYRDVPLMPSETEPGVVKPLAPRAVPLIAWRVRNVSDPSSRVVMTGIHSCANCHSFSRDGKTMGMDLDGPRNDKGLYAIVPVSPRMTLRQENVVEWSTFRGKLGGALRVGFMSQISPDGRRVVTTINNLGEAQSDYQRRRNPQDLVRNYYVANFKDYRFLQVFYPTRGILAWYDPAAGHLQALPGADDAGYVHTDAVWSPDGKYIVFGRAAAKDAYPPGAAIAESANDANETQIRYDLYRIPFNDGKGGRAEPIAGASFNGMSNSFPKVSPDGRWIVYVQARNGQLMRPDSQLYIVPAAGGEARRMNCNTRLMNSWHSFSPNGRWLVFSSKSRSPYTQMFLTHLDADGNDSPAILIENSTAANRAVNIPEFVNIPPDGLMNIDAPVTDYYRVIDTATDLAKEHKSAEAAAEWRKAVAMNPKEASNHFNLGGALFDAGSVVEAIAQYNQALDLSPEYAETHTNLAAALARNGNLDDAIAHFTKALELNPANTSARSNLGAVLAQAGRTGEAIPYLRDAAAERPRDADAQTNLGLALALARQFDEAIRCLQEAVTASPDSSEYRFNLGRVLVDAGHFAEAIPHFEQAVRLSHGREPQILDMLAGAYAGTGRFLEAAQAARQALEVAGQSNPQFLDTLKSRISYYESRIPKVKQ
jgi:tetratricopeptide (TPR) repeat protein